MKLKVLAMLTLLALTILTLPAAAAAGAVYTLTNAASGNSVMMFNRASNGHLALGGTFATGGTGSGAGLGSQSSVILNASNRFLFAVNAGSNSISVFSVTVSGLTLVETDSSSGQNPISLASFGTLLYVLNHGAAVGGTDTIAGFSVDANGHLTNVSRGIALSAPSVNPAQISFNPEGNLLVVTEKDTNNIDVFFLDDSGNVTGSKVMPSAASTPYGFGFGRRDTLIVSDAVGGSSGAGTVSSYFLPQDDSAGIVTGSAPDHQTAPCWIAVTNDGLYAYTTNTGSGTVSSYSVGYSGKISLVNASAASLGATSAPIDLAISNDARFLYVLGSGTGVIQGFGIDTTGGLTHETTVNGLPASVSGLAVR